MIKNYDDVSSQNLIVPFNEDNNKLRYKSTCANN
jgi:hypothetical protein